jgi:hypothetical protein
MMYFVYILRTLDNSLYIGVTENVDERIAAHKSGNGAEWTRSHCGARLVYSEPYFSRVRHFRVVGFSTDAALWPGGSCWMHYRHTGKPIRITATRWRAI